MHHLFRDIGILILIVTPIYWIIELVHWIATQV